MRHPLVSSVRSTMVDATLRGEVPPSTMSGMRLPNCCCTLSAVVHSLAPLRLAEVAVMGCPMALHSATGIAAEGTRKATLTVFAVTFNGRDDDAFTMMVSGPGQNFRARS